MNVREAMGGGKCSCGAIWPAFWAVMLLLAGPVQVRADGKVFAPRDYKGSLEERAQEAMIVFRGAEEGETAKEDLILKIQVEGKAERFAWVIPFPSEVEVAEESPLLFRELFRYVELQSRPAHKSDSGMKSAEAKPTAKDEPKVEVLSRQIVGSFDVAVVRERDEGGLNPWLEKEGFARLEGADDVLGFYRRKGYVMACLKAAKKGTEQRFESHPLRFTFATGGRDGIYFPMRLTGLQTQPFDVNLYVFYTAWLNDHKNEFGYEHRGFSLRYRDWDTSECEPNAGKTWSLPERDSLLKGAAYAIPTVKQFFQARYPGGKFYLTNIQALGLKPAVVRGWADDLWLFPYYTNPKMVPYDARPGKAAAEAWPTVTETSEAAAPAASGGLRAGGWSWPLVVVVAGACGALVYVYGRRGKASA